MANEDLVSLHRLVWTALLAALIVVGAYLHFPIGPVPISTQCLFVILAGLVLGPVQGVLAVALYLGAGLIGLPVFYGGTSGLGHLLGPTGGYLFGFLGASFVAGLSRKFCKNEKLPFYIGILFGLLAYLPIYGLGIPWLKLSLQTTWLKAFSIGMFPFLPSDILQILGAAYLGSYLLDKKMVRL